MKSRIKFSTFFYILPISASMLFTPLTARAADWFTVQSNDKKVSVQFPHKAETFEVVTSKSPAGSVKTEVVKHEQDGIMLTISDSPLPGLAVLFAGSDTILKNAAAGVMSKAYGKETSSESTKIGGAPAMILHYEAANFNDPNHGGYKGLAILVIVDKHLYTINTMLTKDNAETKATQDRLLKSINVAG